MLRPLYTALSLAFYLNAFAGHAPMPEDFTKVSLVVAQAAGQLESKFGHAFLRFTKSADYDVTADVAVEFGADLEGGSVNYLRGVGIGGGYAFDIKPSPFQTVWLSNTHVQERNLYHYELNLATADVQKLVRNLNQYVVGEKQATYNFLTRNCSTQVAEILNSVLNNRIGGLEKNVPVWLPARLKALGLVRREFTVPSIKTLRAEIVDRALDDALSGIDHLFTQNLRVQLAGPFADRIVAYVKLIELAKLYPSSGNKLRSFVKRMSTNELLTARMDILRLANGEFSGMYQLVAFSEESTRKFLTPGLEASFKGARFSAEFTERRGAAVFRLTADDNCQEEATVCARETFTFTHPELRAAAAKRFIELNGQPVAYRGRHKNFQTLIAERFRIIPEVVTVGGRPVLLPIVIQDFANADKTNLKGLVITNKTDAANPFGMCAGFALTQRALMSNVFFRPEGAKRSKSFYTEGLLNAVAGKQIFGPGVANIEELSANADRKVLEDLISATNSHYNQFIRLSAEWLSTRKLGPDSIAEVAYLTSKGLYPLLTFQPFPERRLEHMLVVYGVRDLGDRHQLLVYDPNIGLIPEDYVVKFFINKDDLSLSSTFYRRIEPGHIPRLR